MLALARGEGQSIIIDGKIEVKIVKWSRSSVRLAIQAPREITVDRDEIWRKMHPGEMTPLEKAEVERRERFAREGVPGGGPAAGTGVSVSGNGGEIEAEGIVSPAEGVFYGSAGPGGAPFVSPGSAVEAGTLVGTVREGEALHDLRAEVAGVVMKVAGSGKHVSAGEVVVWIRPAKT